MKILNRPMFRYGGPIKEGIMDGIKEPRQRYAQAGDVFKQIAEGYQTGPQVSEPLRSNQKPRSDVLNAASQLGIANPYKDNSKFYMPLAMNKTVTKPTDLSPDVATMGGYGEIEQPYIDYQKIPKYIEDQDGDGIRDINPEYTKNKSFVNDIFGGPFKRKTDERFAPVEADGPVGIEGKDLTLSAIDKVLDKKRIDDGAENADDKRKKSINGILEKLGYARSQKNALYDALIKGGQRISREGLGKEGLVADLIQDTSTSYDKPEKIREAAELMQIQQDLKLDQITASKTNKMEEDFNFLSSKVGKAKATAILTKDDASSDDAYLRLKGLSNVTPNEAVLGAVRAMVNLGESDIAQEDIKGEISKKEYREGIGQFKKSTEFKEKGAGVYVYEGIVVQIENDGTHEIIKTFGSVNDKAKKWFGLIDK